jgi:hypothetical protein
MTAGVERDTRAVLNPQRRRRGASSSAQRMEAHGPTGRPRAMRRDGGNGRRRKPGGAERERHESVYVASSCCRVSEGGAAFLLSEKT